MTARAARTCVDDDSTKKEGRASKLRDFQARTDTVIMWVFMAIHVEEATNKRTTWRPRKSTNVEEMPSHFPTQATDV